MNDIFDLEGRVALVTGASSGLGRHFALVLAQAGATVIAGARRLDRLEALVAEIETAGGDALAVRLDVTEADSVEAAFDAAEAAFGLVDIVVNNAGVGIGVPLEAMRDDEWQRTLDTNLTAVHRVAAEAARRLFAAGQPGSIVNIASILGLRVSQAIGGYSASKAAVVQLTKSQALEWSGRGVRVNAICPGYFPSEMTADYLASDQLDALLRRIPMRRIGRLEDLTGPLLLLASGASSFMSGSIIAVDGGHLCSGL